MNKNPFNPKLLENLIEEIATATPDSQIVKDILEIWDEVSEDNGDWLVEVNPNALIDR